MQQTETIRPIEVYLQEYANSHRHPTNKLLHRICVPLLAFSLLGLIWAIPMPYVGFLGKMNGYINLATLLILFSMLYYIRLSVPLAVAMAVSIMVFSAGIITLEKQHRLAGWPDMWQVCLGIFVLALAGQLAGYKPEGKTPSLLQYLRFMLTGPAWFWQAVFQKFRIRY